MPQPTLEHLNSWLTDILSQGVNLSPWEEDFVQSQSNKRMRWGAKWEPSPREAEIIERIYTEKVP